MDQVGLALVTLLGLLIGAGINRLGTDLPARHPPRRPRCPYCGRPRPWYQWVAVPAYLFGHARCPRCGAPIRIRYPLVELALAFLFGFLYLRYGPTVRFGFFAAYTAILTLVAITDLERRLILNVVIVPAMALAIVGSFFTGHLSWKGALLGGLIAYVTFLGLALIGNALVGPGALGGGDVKLAAFVGLITGFPLVIEAIVLTTLAGGLISFVLLITRLRRPRDPIPYGPFLIVGGWVTLLWGMEIAQWFFGRM